MKKTTYTWDEVRKLEKKYKRKCVSIPSVIAGNVRKKAHILQQHNNLYSCEVRTLEKIKRESARQYTLSKYKNQRESVSFPLPSTTRDP